MKRLTRLTLAGVLLAAALPAFAGEVKVSFSNGLVTVVATDATPRQILAEWALQGQVRITNLDRLSGGPVTLQLVGVPEAQALETLLRGTAGYVAAPRAEAMVASSSYDRILLMPGVAPTAPVPGASSGSTSNIGFGRGRPSGPPAFDSDDGDDSGPARPTAGMGQGTGRDAGRPDPYRQPGPGQIVTPGMLPQAPTYYPGMSNPQVSGPGQQVPAAANQRQPSSPGASTPGVMTAPPQPLPIKTPSYSNDGASATSAQPGTSSAVPGQLVGQPGQAAGAPVSAGRPGEVTSPASAPFQNPYGLPESVRPPVVNPAATPYGLPATVKTTPAPTPPAGPIKQSGADGGQN